MIPIAKDIQKQDIRQLNAARYPHLSSTVFDICALVTGRQIPPSPGFLLQICNFLIVPRSECNLMPFVGIQGAWRKERMPKLCQKPCELSRWRGVTLVPERAIVPKLLTRSAFVIPASKQHSSIHCVCWRAPPCTAFQNRKQNAHRRQSR